MAIWPMENGSSSFTLWDEEDKVVFNVDNSTNNIIVKWNKSEKNYLLRINYNQDIAPKKVISESINNEILNEFEGLQNFLSSDRDGWVYDAQIRKIIVRKTNCSKSNLIKIYK